MSRTRLGEGLALLLIAGWGCSEPIRVPLDLPGIGEGEPALGIHLVAAEALDVPDGLVVAVSTGGLEALGMDASLRWDPGALRYVGQIPVAGTAAVANDSRALEGLVVWTMLDPLNESDQESVFVFQVVRSVSEAGMELLVERTVTRAGVQGPVLSALRRGDLLMPDAGEPARLAWEEWAPVLDASFRLGEPRGARVPGEGFRFGDPTLDGVINVLDALYAANVSVGNRTIAQCIVGTDAPARDCIAANVRPENAPGLGEVGDPCPPGVDSCGVEGRTINVLDALAISLESVGLDQAVVGETVPGSLFTPPDTVTLSGTLTGTRALTSDTAYVLSGSVLVGDEAGDPGDLSIEAGTRIVALPGAQLRVTRNGRIHAGGTQFEPVVLGCFGTPTAGCWRGLKIDGNATVNTGTPDSPPLVGRSTGGCLQASVGAEQFGGCEDADSSGVIRFVRVQHAGQGGEAAVSLRGVGSRTVVEQVYSLGSAGAGVSALGGVARIKRLRVIAAGTVGLEWSMGWRGALQFGVVQTVAIGSAAIRGASSPAITEALPRSAPVLRNVTIVGPPDPAAQADAAGGVILEAGTDATLRSFLVLAQPRPESHLLDVDGVSTWTRFDDGQIRFDSSFIAGYARLGALDVDPPTVAGYHSPDAEGQLLKDPATGNVLRMLPAVLDSVLIAPYATVSDLRPHPFGSPATAIAGCPSPPAGDPFFEPAPYCGAVGVPSISTGEIPWFEPAPLYDMTPSPLSPAPGLLVVRVESAAQLPIAGVSLNGGSVTTFGITGLDGLYRSYTAPGGSLFTLGGLPLGCSFPDVIGYTGPGAGQLFYAVETLPC